MKEWLIILIFAGITLLILSNLELYRYVIWNKKRNLEDEMRKVRRVRKLQSMVLAGFIVLIGLTLVVRIVKK